MGRWQLRMRQKSRHGGGACGREGRERFSRIATNGIQPVMRSRRFVFAWISGGRRSEERRRAAIPVRGQVKFFSDDLQPPYRHAGRIVSLFVISLRFLKSVLNGGGSAYRPKRYVHAVEGQDPTCHATLPSSCTPCCWSRSVAPAAIACKATLPLWRMATEPNNTGKMFCMEAVFLPNTVSSQNLSFAQGRTRSSVKGDHMRAENRTSDTVLRFFLV